MYDKERQKESKKKYLMANPWLKTLNNIRYRCNNPNDRKYKYYGGRGIKCLLSVQDIKFLWERDATKLKQPSIDRIDSSLDYEVSNCRFIEMSENRMKRKFSGGNICGFCNKPTNGTLYCSRSCMQYNAQLNWLTKLKEKGVGGIDKHI